MNPDVRAGDEAPKTIKVFTFETRQRRSDIGATPQAFRMGRAAPWQPTRSSRQ